MFLEFWQAILPKLTLCLALCTCSFIRNLMIYHTWKNVQEYRYNKVIINLAMVADINMIFFF